MFPAVDILGTMIILKEEPNNGLLRPTAGPRFEFCGNWLIFQSKVRTLPGNVDGAV